MDEPSAQPIRSLPVLAQDPPWIVVAKPPRLLVHRAPIAKADHYALQLLRDQLGQWVYPIHRLDRPASGCLLFALERRAVPSLQQALASDDAVKTYLAFVRGEWRRETPVVVDNPMKDDGGTMRDALSEVACVGTSREPRCSLLRVRPRTGRFHQVRRHVRDLDHPVLGDAAHGDTRANRWWREQFGLPRLGLHCVSLDLPLPGGTRLRATCPVYEDLHRVWRALPWWDRAVAAIPALALPPLPVPDYLVTNGAD
jgi:tRNA pseudouridine65 synthase